MSVTARRPDRLGEGWENNVRRCMTLGIVLALSIVALTACSSDGEGDTTSRAFAAEANAICADFFSAVEALETPSASEDALPSTLTDDQIAEGVAFFEAYLEVEDEQLTRLRALNPPSSARQGFEEFVDAWSARRDAAEAAIRAFENRDDVEYEKASSEVTAAAFQGATAAQALKLETCQGEG